MKTNLKSYPYDRSSSINTMYHEILTPNINFNILTIYTFTTHLIKNLYLIATPSTHCRKSKNKRKKKTIKNDEIYYNIQHEPINNDKMRLQGCATTTFLIDVTAHNEQQPQQQ